MPGGAEGLAHPDDGQSKIMRKRNLVPIDNGVTESGIKGLSRKSRNEFSIPEAGFDHGDFASDQNGAPDPAASPVGMNEESTNASRVARGIKLLSGGRMGLAGAKQSFAFAPPSAPNNVFGRLRDKVGAIVDQLTINPENRAESSIHLSCRIVRGLK
jgi:hypothetical protein